MKADGLGCCTVNNSRKDVPNSAWNTGVPEGDHYCQTQSQSGRVEVGTRSSDTHVHTRMCKHTPPSSPSGRKKPVSQLELLNGNECSGLPGVRGEPMPSLTQKLPGCGKASVLVSSSHSPSDKSAWRAGLATTAVIVNNRADVLIQFFNRRGSAYSGIKTLIKSPPGSIMPPWLKSVQGRTAHETEGLTPRGV